ncbi:DUF6795 domain-containing protein [Pseudoalteromonas sp. B62]|uniref:DUF6795 domain-containing protein n=1 Tax=Pseudoalteromonas sp. B62 TaxID=630483 RepID=UPI00301E61F4
MPIADLEIIRSLTYIDGVERLDSVITSDDGRFHLPRKTILSSIPNKLISEDRVHQNIFIRKGNNLIIGLWGLHNQAFQSYLNSPKSLSF